MLFYTFRNTPFRCFFLSASFVFKNRYNTNVILMISGVRFLLFCRVLFSRLRNLLLSHWLLNKSQTSFFLIVFYFFHCSCFRVDRAFGQTRPRKSCRSGSGAVTLYTRQRQLIPARPLRCRVSSRMCLASLLKSQNASSRIHRLF